MIFEYQHPMRQEYAPTAPLGTPDEGRALPFVAPQSAVTGETGFGIKDIGMSVPLGISAQNVMGIRAKIFSGTGNIELAFPGAVRGQRQAQTPEMYGLEQRRAIREIGRANEINFTTHASYGIMGLAGFTGDNPYNAWFTREQKKIALDELKRAIEFARDAAGGGSVVVHTGEVERSISEQPWAVDRFGRHMFKEFEEEPEVAKFRVVDERSGQVLQQVRKQQRVARPEWLRATNSYSGYDTQGNRVLIRGPVMDENGRLKADKDGIPIFRGDYIDYEGRKVPDHLVYNFEHGRVPIYNKQTGRFVDAMYDWKRMMEETRERNEWKKKMLGRKMTDEEKLLPEEVYLRSTLETNEGHSRGWAGQYGIEMNHDIEALKKLKKAYEFYQKLEKDIPEDEKWKIMREERIVNTELVPPDVKNPTDILKKQIEQAERRILFSRQASDSQLMQAEDSHETQQYLISAHKYAIREATKAYAEAGIYAMDNTIDPKKPIAITMENIFPERFGGHPDELKILINEARKEMVERLSHKYIRDPANKREKDQVTHEITGEIIKIPNPYYRGIPEEQARKEANEHIKATLDTGHLNTWRKYWQTDPKKSIEENNNEFNKWILKQVEDLARNNMIGNVHLTDNYGYQDDHLAPGQGNAPVKDILKILKKHGYSGPLTVEPGADASTDQSDFHGLMKAWSHLGAYSWQDRGFIAPSALPQQNWSDVQYSYFGRSYPPYFIFGDFAPSRDWTLWSQVPVE